MSLDSRDETIQAYLNELKQPKKAVKPMHFFKNFPDFSSFKVPYSVICYRRYQNAIKTYNKQFLYELKMQETMQSTAYDAMRFHRHFVYTTLWPPLHTKREIYYVLNKMYKLTPKQDKRLKELMSYDLN